MQLYQTVYIGDNRETSKKTHTHTHTHIEIHTYTQIYREKKFLITKIYLFIDSKIKQQKMK